MTTAERLCHFDELQRVSSTFVASAADAAMAHCVGGAADAIRLQHGRQVWVAATQPTVHLRDLLEGDTVIVHDISERWAMPRARWWGQCSRRSHASAESCQRWLQADAAPEGQPLHLTVSLRVIKGSSIGSGADGDSPGSHLTAAVMDPRGAEILQQELLSSRPDLAAPAKEFGRYSLW